MEENNKARKFSKRDRFADWPNPDMPMIAMRHTVPAVFALFVSLLLATNVSAAKLPDFRDIVKEGSPAVVMSLIFAGAPIVNAFYAISAHPPAGGFGAIKWQFYAGILAAALGGCLVTLYKPMPAGAKKKAAVVQVAPAEPAEDKPADTPPAQ